MLPQAKADVQRNAKWWAQHHSSELAATWLDAIQSQLTTLVDFPESHSLSAENDAFPYEIHDKLLGLGSRPTNRAIFTIKNENVYVLTVRRASQDTLQPNQISAPPALTASDELE
jgi:plasmid stabilization system protein ParE